LNMYVANLGTSNISVLSGLKVVRTVPGPSGSFFSGLAYDPATDQMFVSAWGTGQVYVYD